MFGPRFAVLLGTALATGTLPASAQIVTDGSVGPAVELAGSNVEIGADLGRIAGGKLLHSFADFNIATGGSATFTGPAGLSDVIARVTGGAPSSLDGLLRSTIPDAAVTFANPAGVLLGPNFFVDVPTAFHLTTADSLGFADGSKLATGLPTDAVLSVAPLASFGFLGAEPGVIISDGATFGVRPGQRLSLIGGGIGIDGGGQPNRVVGGLSAEVRMASVGGPASVDLATGRIEGPGGAILVQNLGTLFVGGDGTGLLGVDTGTLSLSEGGFLLGNSDGTALATGGIEINADRIEINGGTIGISNFGDGPTGGTLRITTGSLSIANGNINNDTRAAGGAGLIEVAADSVVMRAGGAISAVSLSGGNAGTVLLRTNALEIDGMGLLGPAAGVFAGILTQGTGTGQAGKIEITGREPGAGSAGFNRAAKIVAKRGGAITAINTGNGAGGTITIGADHIELDDQALGLPTGISASAQTADGGAGVIIVDAGELVVREGATITADAGGDGDAGRLDINADSIVISSLQGLPVQVSASSSIGGDNRPGAVTIRAGSLEIEGFSVIQASSFGTGPAGSIDITARRIRLTGTDSTTPTGILSQAVAEDAGAAGSIAVRASEQLIVENFARIGSDSTSASGAAAGTVTVSGGEIIVRGEGTISSVNLLPEGGDAGTVDVSGSRVLVDGGSISTFGLGATGGSITIAGDEQILLNDATVLTTGVEFAPGTTLITLAAPQIVINSSRVFSTVDSTGPAVPGDRTSGSAAFLGDTTIISTDSQILVTNEITVTGLDAEIGSDLSIDQPTLINAERLLGQACASARPAATSSFAVSSARLERRAPDSALSVPLPKSDELTLASACP